MLKSVKFLSLNKPVKLILVVYVILMSFMMGMWAQSYLLKRDAPVSSNEQAESIDLEKLQEQVLPSKGYVFKISWGSLGKKMVEDGVIDKAKLAQAVAGQNTLPPEMEKYFSGNEQTIELTSQNSHFWVDVLWGLGLSNKNEILEKGPMIEGGNAANFASTGGYTLGVGKPMTYYSKFNYINLDTNEQALVEEIAAGVFRPCCGNSTAFPDCNHGMAALGLIELMVSQGFSKEETFQAVLAFNSYWFPQTYLDIAYHFAKNGREYTDIPSSQLLSQTFSSSSGYQAVKRQIGEVDWPLLQKGGGCGA